MNKPERPLPMLWIAFAAIYVTIGAVTGQVWLLAPAGFCLFLAGVDVEAMRHRPRRPEHHVLVVCPDCGDHIRIDVTSVLGHSLLVSAGDLDMQAHQLTHADSA